jgi:hypothetical protein
MIVAMLRQAGLSRSLRGFDDFRTGFVAWLTRIGNKCCDSVFGPMAFFPIVIRKVERYVAMHKRKRARPAGRPALERESGGGGAHFDVTVRPGGIRASHGLHVKRVMAGNAA